MNLRKTFTSLLSSSEAQMCLPKLAIFTAFSKSVKSHVVAYGAYISRLRRGMCNSRSMRRLLVDRPTTRVALSHDPLSGFSGGKSTQKPARDTRLESRRRKTKIVGMNKRAITALRIWLSLLAFRSTPGGGRVAIVSLSKFRNRYGMMK